MASTTPMDAEDPHRAAGSWSECYPYTAIVGVPELGYDDKRPAYKRAAKGMPAAEAWPIRTAACDELIRRVARLADFDPRRHRLPPRDELPP